ncbi:hypothetical protein N9B17_03435 [Rhodopirellula sp.]|nr:hypothetical protein [Rhodopirellula sp.]
MAHEKKSLANLKTSVRLYGNRLQKWDDAQTKISTSKSLRPLFQDGMG